VARLRQLRHVPRLRAPRRGVPERRAGAGRRSGADARGRRRARRRRGRDMSSPAAATPNARPGFLSGLSGLFGRARRGMDALPMHLPVRLGGSDFTQTKAAPVRVLGFDQAMLWVIVALLAWGLVMVYSASIALGDNPRFARANYGQGFFVLRHGAFIAIAFIAGLLAFQVPMRQWERIAPWLFIVSILLLVLVLIPHIGRVVNGARRWLPLG